MELSKRLQAVAEKVDNGNIVCDVGCDHGYVSIYLTEKKISPKVYAMDVRTGPLERAKEHIKEYGFEQDIQVILSDGLKSMPEEKADTLICAGMGGRLVIKILSDSLDKVKRMQQLILQPQSEIWLVREFLRQCGFVIYDEDMVEEDGKFYPILCVRVSGAVHSDESLAQEEQALFDKYGPKLLAKKHPVLKQYLLWESMQFQKIEQELQQMGKESEKKQSRLLTLKQEMVQNEKAQSFF